MQERENNRLQVESGSPLLINGSAVLTALLWRVVNIKSLKVWISQFTPTSKHPENKVKRIRGLDKISEPHRQAAP